MRDRGTGKGKEEERKEIVNQGNREKKEKKKVEKGARNEEK